MSYYITIKWYVEDILEVANKSSIELSYEEAKEILDKMKECHDASIGINWDVILTSIIIYIGDREERDEETE